MHRVRVSSDRPTPSRLYAGSTRSVCTQNPLEISKLKIEQVKAGGKAMIAATKMETYVRSQRAITVMARACGVPALMKRSYSPRSKAKYP